MNKQGGQENKEQDKDTKSSKQKTPNPAPVMFYIVFDASLVLMTEHTLKILQGLRLYTRTLPW